jgi:hypothetical protein
MNRLPTEKLKFPKINTGLIIEQISYRTEGIVVTKYSASLLPFFNTDGGTAHRLYFQGPIKFFSAASIKQTTVSSYIFQLFEAIQFFQTIQFSLEVQFSWKVLILKNDIMERKILPSGGFF